MRCISCILHFPSFYLCPLPTIMLSCHAFWPPQPSQPGCDTDRLGDFRTPPLGSTAPPHVHCRGRHGGHRCRGIRQCAHNHPPKNPHPSEPLPAYRVAVALAAAACHAIGAGARGTGPYLHSVVGLVVETGGGGGWVGGALLQASRGRDGGCGTGCGAMDDCQEWKDGRVLCGAGMFVIAFTCFVHACAGICRMRGGGGGGREATPPH